MIDLSSVKFTILNVFEGFDFLDWHFKVCNNYNLLCFPSFLSYQKFLIRVKHILNNSNYGVCVKVSVWAMVLLYFIYFIIVKFILMDLCCF